MQCDHRGRDLSDVATSQGMIAITRSQRSQGIDFHLESPERHTALPILWFQHINTDFRPPASQNNERTNFCCFKPLRLWQFVLEPIENYKGLCQKRIQLAGSIICSSTMFSNFRAYMSNHYAILLLMLSRCILYNLVNHLAKQEVQDRYIFF